MGGHHTKEQTAELLHQGVERIRELTVDGVAPSTAEYNALRGEGMPSADYLRRHGYPWPMLMEMAGVAGRTHGTRKGRKQNNGNTVPEALEAEIRKHFEDGDHLPSWRREWPLTVIPTALEVKEFLLPDGKVYRLTRAYASIR